MEKTIQIFQSFADQEKAERQYWKNLSGDEKLEILEAIRFQYWALNNEHPRRLQRVYRIVER
jgi:hypothetical protein